MMKSTLANETVVRGSAMEIRPRTARRAPGALTAPIASLLLAAVFLLAPGEARAANECGGAISTTVTSRTCTGTSYTGGIIYLNVAPGPSTVATVNVEGSSSTMSVTSGNGAGFSANGITLDSDEPATGSAGGGLALTVGSTGGNVVNILQRASNPNSGNDNNNGILINQQRRDASTTTVTVHSGVAIGASGSGNRMNRYGIRANVWLGTGAATFTSAATIHSVLEGIFVQRGDSADTSAATTITNTGAITAGTRAIYLRYLGGDEVGGGGQGTMRSHRIGDAKITNSGVLTKHTGTGNQGAIELDYDRGRGNAEVDNSGAITATASGVTNGYGIYLQYRNRGPAPGNTVGAGDATGTATITNTAAIASKQTAIYLDYHGRGGATRITNSGALTVENTSGSDRFGIFLFDRGTTNAVDGTTKTVTVDNSNAITSTGLGINVNVINKNTAGDDVGIAITHSAGAISVSAAGGIKANIADNDDVAANNVGDIRIRVTGGSVESRDTILEASHSQAGDVIFEVSDGVTLTSMAQHGIFANVPSANTMGDITVTNAGTITTPKTGIFVRRSASTGTGNIRVTNNGDIKKSGTAVDWDGILVEDLGVGAVTVANSGDIGEATATAKHERGIRVNKTGNGGNISITNGGSIFAGKRGVWVAHGGTSGTISITTTDGSITAEEYGILVTDTGDHEGAVTISNGGDVTSSRPITVVRNGEGDVTVTNTGGTVLSSTYSAVSARNKSGDASDVRVDVSGGTLRSPGNAIQAFNRGTGDVLHTFGADATLISESGDAVYTTLFSTLTTDNQVKIAQGGAIMGRTGLYARVGGSSTAETVPMRDAGKSDVIDVTWTGSFSHGVTEAEKEVVSQSDAGRFSGSFANTMLFSMQTLEGDDATGGVYGGAAGVEAQVMSRRDVIREVALGDDPGAFADNAAQMTAVPTGATAADNAYVAQFRAALEDERFDIDSSVLTAIATGTTAATDLTDAQIVTYLQEDDGPTRALLRNILALGLSDKEQAVLEALATGADKEALEAVLMAEGFTDDAADDEDYWSKVTALLNRYNPGGIRVAMNGGSIASRGDGIRAYYATANDRNGAIDIAVGLTAMVTADGMTSQAASSATVTGGKTGIYVANAGAMGTGADRILKQTVNVYNGAVTGGTDAAVHMVGGGTLTVHEMGKVIAGAGRPAILVNDPGRAVVTILGEVEGSEGADAAVDLAGGGSVTVGPMGRVNTNEGGATRAFKVGGGTYQVAVYAAGTALTKGGVNEARMRVGGGFTTDTGGMVTTRPDADGNVQEGAGFTVVEMSGDYTTGMFVPLAIDPATGEPTTEGNDVYAALADCPEAGQELQDDGTCMTPPPPMVEEEEEETDTPGDGGRVVDFPVSCDMMGDRCRLYEALPSMLLAMNGLPTYAERASAARDARGSWARVEAASGRWEADDSTLAYDHHRRGLRAGVDFVADETGRLGVSVHGLRGSAEMASVGDVDMSASGVGVHATTFSSGGFHVDVQAAMTWYDVDVKSSAPSPRALKSGVKGRGYAVGVEAGRRMPGAGGVSVTPRAGLAWSKVSLDGFTEEGMRAHVSVDDAESLKGRAGVSVETAADGGEGGRLFGAVDLEQEFSEETVAKVSGTALAATAETTRLRFAVGGDYRWGDGRYALRSTVGYAAGGAGNHDFGAGVNFAMSF